MIVLDTSLLSAVLRRRKRGEAEAAAAERLKELIVSDEALIVPGIVFQELLSGVPTHEQFAALENELSAYKLVTATRRHHVEAAHVSNTCRAAGVQVSAPDALIVATTIIADGRLFTLDEDFQLIARRYPKLKLCS